MAGPFDITTATNTLRLGAGRKAETLFTVFNNSGRALRGRARIVALTAAAQSWLTLAGDAERDFPIATAQQYNIGITAPPDAAAGVYQFRLDAVGVDNPDEELSEGPTVQFEVPILVVAKQSFPIWIPIAAVAALVLVVLVFAVASAIGSPPVATPTAVATATTAPPTSTPAPPVVVRNVVGLTEAQALDALRSQGLRAKVVTRRVLKITDVGKVLLQDPVGGATVPRTIIVLLTVGANN